MLLPSISLGRAIRNLVTTTALVLAGASAAQAQSYVNVTVGGAFVPGVYGQVALGNSVPPPVLNMQPVVVGAPLYGTAPMYLHVAPYEYRDWGRHCRRYRACGRPVYFVQVDPRNPWWEYRGRPHHDHRWEHRHDHDRHGWGERRH